MRQSPIGRGFAGLSGSDKPPVIGLTTYLNRARLGVWDVPASFLPAVYFHGVTAAGGVAMLLPPQPVNADIAERVLDGLDGLLITGGKDVDPAAYGQEPHPSTDKPGQQRDAWEFALLRAALKRAASGAGHLPRRAGAQRRAGRDAASAPARCHRPQRTPGRQRRIQHVAGAHRGRHPAGRRWSANPLTRGAITTRPSPISARDWWSAAGMPMV